jgi:hypothetical protein
MCKFEQAEKVECISTCRFIDKVFNLRPLVSYSNNISGTKKLTSWKAKKGFFLPSGRQINKAQKET